MDTGWVIVGRTTKGNCKSKVVSLILEPFAFSLVSVLDYVANYFQSSNIALLFF